MADSIYLDQYVSFMEQMKADELINTELIKRVTNENIEEKKAAQQEAEEAMSCNICMMGLVEEEEDEDKDKDEAQIDLNQIFPLE